MQYPHILRKGSRCLPAPMHKLLVLCWVASLGIFFSANSASAQDAAPKTLLWQISKPELANSAAPKAKPSYLFGTIHLTDSRVFRFADQVPEALASVNAFAMELLPDAGLQMQMMTAMMMRGDTTLSQILPDETYAKLDSILQANLNVPLETFDRFQPVFISMLLMQKDIEVNPNQLFLDMYLSKLAEGLGKPLFGLETGAEQIGALTGLPVAKQVELLIKALADYKPEDEDDEKAGSEIQKMISVYMEQDLAAMVAMSDSSEQMSADFMDLLLTKRNVVMAHRLDSLINLNGSVFCAVGSLHLPSAGGLVDLMTQKGYVLTPVLPTFKRLDNADDVSAWPRMQIWPKMQITPTYTIAMPFAKVPERLIFMKDNKPNQPFTICIWNEISLGRNYQVIYGLAQTKKKAKKLLEQLYQVEGFPSKTKGKLVQSFSLGSWGAYDKNSGSLRFVDNHYLATGCYLLPTDNKKYIPVMVHGILKEDQATDAAQKAIVEFVKSVAKK